MQGLGSRSERVCGNKRPPAQPPRPPLPTPGPSASASPRKPPSVAPELSKVIALRVCFRLSRL